jgi:Fe-S cluster assembly protein SufD
MTIKSIEARVPTWLEQQWHECLHLETIQPLTQIRKDNWHAFTQKGLPTKKNENWKYTDLTFLETASYSLVNLVNTVDVDYIHKIISSYRLQDSDSILLVLVNGCFIPAMSDLNKLPKNVIINRLEKAWQEQEMIIKQCHTNDIDHPFVNLNEAMWKEGLFIYIPDGCDVTLPIHLLSIATEGVAFIAHTRHVIVLGERSRVTLLEDYAALSAVDYMMNLVVTMLVNKQAKLNHYKIQRESNRAVHMAYTVIKQMENSEVTTTHFSSGASFARDDLKVTLQETGASCQLASFYHLHQDHQYIDYHIDVDHIAHNSHSDMLYKGILDKQSRAVFSGKLFVEKEAQKIIAYQANHNILLSKEAEVYSKPMLEVYADDVKCKHGATIGQLNHDALFYLCSRGINQQEALNMLLNGFTDDIFSRVTHPGIKQHAQKTVRFR